MKRYYSILLLFVLLFALSQAGQASNSYQYRWIENVANYFPPTFTYYNYSLQTNALQLPGEDKTFSSQAHKMLLDLAELYGENSLDLSLNEPILSLINTADGGGEGADGGFTVTPNLEPIKLSPLPGVLLNADYNQDRDDLRIETKTNVELKYQVNSRTQFRAGYGLVNKEWWNVQEISLKEDEQVEGGNTVLVNDPADQPGTEPNPEEPTITDVPADERTVQEETKQEAMVFNEETNQASSFGISYQTNDYLTISADYINDGFFNQGNKYSTIFGVEYTDKAGKLRAKYQVDQGENVSQQITGLELAFNNQATFSASYKLLDPQLLTDQLNKETVWDFGLDLSLTDLSSLSIGYQMINNQEEENVETEEEEKETNIKASLKIKF